MTEVYVTREEAARRLSLSVRQLDRLIAEWAIPVARLRSSVRIRVRDLEAWMEAMSNGMSVEQTALFFSLSPESIVELVRGGGLPHERQGSQLRFYKPLLEKWRREIEPSDRLFADIDDRAECLQEELGRRGIRVELLPCVICARDSSAQPRVAADSCHLCHEPICFPHGLHYLRNGKDIRLSPDRVCDACFEEHHPATF
jgi:excisionase family DNA binding protein